MHGATTISLNVAETATLADIIAACPAGEELANLDQVRHKSYLSEYQFAMAVRRLESVDFVETMMVEGDFGTRFAQVRPTLAAIQWAHEHHDEIEAARLEVAPKSEEDDIPF